MAAVTDSYVNSGSKSVIAVICTDSAGLDGQSAQGPNLCVPVLPARLVQPHVRGRASCIRGSERERIGARQRSASSGIPGYSEMLARNLTDKATVTRVLRILSEDGLVRVVPRWGTFRA
jgi:hypothetical protein